MSPPFIAWSVTSVCLVVIVCLLVWIRLRERHWVRMIDAINASWNSAHQAGPQGYPHSRVLRDHRALPTTALSLGRRSGREVA